VLSHALDQIAGMDHFPALAGEGTQEPLVQVTRAIAEPVPRAQVVRTQVTSEELFVEEYARLVRDTGAGAVATFTGVVRDHDQGRSVRSLHYEGHPSANDVLATVVADIAERCRGVRAMAAGHRLGSLDI